MTKRKEFKISLYLIGACILYTLLVKFIDISQIGPQGTSVGFSTINNFFHKLFGVNMTFYNISEVAGYIALLIAAGYALVGGYQLITRKSFKKVDKEIIAIGAFYVAVLFIYVFFEKVIINYRPTLIDGELEASYPSSHTILSLCICGSAIILNKFKYSRIKAAQYVNKLAIVVAPIILFCRLISGVHWFSDILGGVIISITLLYMFRFALIYMNEKKI